MANAEKLYSIGARKELSVPVMQTCACSEFEIAEQSGRIPGTKTDGGTSQNKAGLGKSSETGYTQGESVRFFSGTGL